MFSEKRVIMSPSVISQAQTSDAPLSGSRWSVSALHSKVILSLSHVHARTHRETQFTCCGRINWHWIWLIIHVSHFQIIVLAPSLCPLFPLPLSICSQLPPSFCQVSPSLHHFLSNSSLRNDLIWLDLVSDSFPWLMAVTVARQQVPKQQQTCLSF